MARSESLLGPLIRPHRRQLAGTVLCYAIKHSPAPLMPVLTAQMIDLALSDRPDRINRLLIYGGILVGLWILNIPMHTLYYSQLSRVTRSVARDLRIRICRQLQALSLLFHYRTNIGKLHAKAIRDMELIEQAPFLVYEVLLSFTMNILVAVVAICMSAPIALLFFAVAVPAAALIRHCFGRALDNRVEDLRSSVERMSGSLNEMLKMIPVTRSHGLEQREIDRIESRIDHVYSHGRRFDLVRALFGSSTYATLSILQVLFLMAAVYACFHDHITVGAVVMFNAFFINLSAQLAGVMTTVPQIAQARESLKSVYEILDAPETEQNEGKHTFESVLGRFELQHVSYRYPGTDRHAVTDVSLTVEPGESVAFIGSSGAGKSTMLSLVLGLICPDQGRIMIDGRDMREMDLRSFRQYVGVVSQEVLLFSGSIYENVSFGKAQATEDEVWSALEQANAADFVRELPDGIHSQLGQDGVRLSGGQQQRISVARAILRNPRVLILDEATSALDQESVEIVQASLDRIMKGRTTFIVSHRESAVRCAERIFRMSNGRITAVEDRRGAAG